MARDLLLVTILAAACVACGGEPATGDESGPPTPTRNISTDMTTAPATATAVLPELTVEMKIHSTGDCLNVRDQPSQAARIVTCLADDTTVLATTETTIHENYMWRRLFKPEGWAVEDWLRPAEGPDLRVGYKCLTGAGRFPYYFTFVKPEQENCQKTTVAVFQSDYDAAYSYAPTARSSPVAPPATSPTVPGVPTHSPERSPTPTPGYSGFPQYTPSIRVSPNHGAPGTTVQVTGEGFPPNALVQVTSTGVTLAQVQATASGELTTSGTVPGVPPGDYIVIASVSTPGGVVSDETTFTVDAVAPSLALEPDDHAEPGELVTVVGTGFHGTFVKVDIRLPDGEIVPEISFALPMNGSFRAGFLVRDEWTGRTLTLIATTIPNEKTRAEITLVVSSAPSSP